MVGCTEDLKKQSRRGAAANLRRRNANGPDHPLLDVVSLFKSKFARGSDLGNICLAIEDEENALDLGDKEAVPCYVRRRALMPQCDKDGKFIADDSYCNGRFRGKLHQRAMGRSISLVPTWKPGPAIPGPETFANGVFDSDEDSGSDNELECECGNEECDFEFEGGF